MNRSILPTIFLISALLLAGCGSANAAGSRFGNAPLTPESKLAIGTLNLEGTPQAVDGEMAAKLLPLWQLLVQLDGSSSTAPQEIQAVVDQIRATMTPAQVQTIDDMHVSAADAFSGFQGQRQGGGGAGAFTGGSGTSRNSGGSTSSSGSRGNGGDRQFFFSGGGPGAPGGGGFGGGGFGGSVGGNPSNTETRSANTAEQTANALSGFLANRVIRLLESKVSG